MHVGLLSRTIFVTALCAAALWALVYAQDARGAPLFDGNQSIVQLTISGPLSKVYQQRKLNKREDVPATLTYQASDGQEVSLSLAVRTRGNFRRRECRQPPLRLNFEKPGLKGTLFEGQNKLKLVVPCRPNDKYEDLVVAEYLTYRLYALLGQYHFAVRPVALRFVETEKRKSPFKDGFGFLIEDLGKMAKRYDREVVDDERTSFKKLDQAELAIVELFQFMIGGHDWSVIGGPKGERCCHNSRLIREPGWETGIIPVPYDFDLTGIVDAPYAFPPEKLPIRNVRQRFFRGRCKGPQLWKLTFDRFKSAKTAVYELYQNDPRLSERKRVRTMAYLDEFFAILESEKRTEDAIVGRCRGTVEG